MQIDYVTCKDWRVMFENPYSDIEAKEVYHRLAKKYHPDSDNVDTEDAFKNINLMYEEALEWFKLCSGSLNSIDDTNVLKVRDQNNKGFDIKYIRKDSYAGVEVFISSSKVCIKFNTDCKDLYDNFLNRVKSFKFANDEVKESLERCIPLIRTTCGGDGGYYIVMERTPDVISLRHLVDYYNKTGDTWEDKHRHTVWIMNRIYNMACALWKNGLGFNGFSLENIYVSPEFHTALFLNGWQYCVGEHEKMIGTTSEIYDIMSIKCKDNKIAEFRTDTESLRMIGRELFGKDAPKEFKKLFDLSGGDNPLEDWKQFEEVYIKYFGGRKFYVFNVNIDKVLEKA